MQRFGDHFWRRSMWLIAGVWMAGSLAWLFHNLKINPHTDMQLVTYTMQMLQSVQDGNVWEYLMTPRKYPLFPSLLLGMLYLGLGGILLMTNIVESVSALGPYFFAEREALYLISRLVILGSAVGSVVLVYHIAAMLYGHKKFGCAAVIILFSSVIFPVFSTALRPHMLVTFMTLLTVYWSMRLREQYSWKNTLFAFGSATLAFCTLQNGLMAFIFPILASGKRPKRILLFGGAAGIFSIVFGYPFLIRTVGEGMRLGALGNTYFDGTGLSGESMKAVGMLLMGSELFLTVFAVGGLLVLWHTKQSLRPVLPILLYLALTILFFGMQTGSVMRFFFPIVPMLAVVSAPALVATALWLTYPFFLLIVLMQMKFMFLGTAPDTFQRTHDLLMQYPDARVSTHLPYYFLDIAPPLPLSAYRRSDIVVVRAGFEPQGFTGFEMCAQFGDSPLSQDGLLWSDSDRDWLLWRLLTIHHLGPTISVYCKEHRLPLPAGAPPPTGEDQGGGV